MMKRLNKYITDAGYCSRREADKYIEQGRVMVNGEVAVLGAMVSDVDMVEVDGEKVGGKKAKRPVYIILNKPVGVTCTCDQTDKTNIIDFIGYKERIFPVGRLDKDSEGLIILTNDGDIVNKILRAGNNNPKEYIVTVNKPVTQGFLDRMSNGVRILGVTTKPCKIYRKNDTTFIIHLTQGLNRQIRRMCQALDYKVVSLKRIKVINVSLDNLETGRWRHFTPEEVRDMYSLLAASSGTEEASNEQRALPARSRKSFKTKPEGSYSQYRKHGRSTKSDDGNKVSKAGDKGKGRQSSKPSYGNAKSGRVSGGQVARNKKR